MPIPLSDCYLAGAVAESVEEVDFLLFDDLLCFLL